MNQKDIEEFIIMLLIENRCLVKEDTNNFYEYINENYDIRAFNARYTQLLDNFLNEYALNKTEKSG